MEYKKPFIMKVHVTYDNYGQRSITITTKPEGIDAQEVKEVIRSLKSSSDHAKSISK